MGSRSPCAPRCTAPASPCATAGMPTGAATGACCGWSIAPRSTTRCCAPPVTRVPRRGSGWACPGWSRTPTASRYEPRTGRCAADGWSAPTGRPVESRGTSGSSWTPSTWDWRSSWSPGRSGTGGRGGCTWDWGADPGTYAWVFPKGDTLTVGVIQRRGHADATRAYLASFIAAQGLSDLPVMQSSGHLTRCRTPTSPLARGRVLVAGDAAGLLEPWTREGISYAVRSGTAGRGGGGRGKHGPRRRPDGCPGRHTNGASRPPWVRRWRRGRIALRAFEHSPDVLHHVVARTGRGWREFARLTGGDATLADAVAHRPVRWGLQLAGRL